MLPAIVVFSRKIVMEMHLKTSSCGSSEYQWLKRLAILVGFAQMRELLVFRVLRILLYESDGIRI